MHTPTLRWHEAQYHGMETRCAAQAATTPADIHGEWYLFFHRLATYSVTLQRKVSSAGAGSHTAVYAVMTAHSRPSLHAL